MLWSILLILLILWLLVFVTGYTMSYAIHLLLFFAIFAMLIKIEDDCSNYCSWLTKKRYLKRHLISRFGYILHKLAVLPAEKESFTNCRER